MILAFLLQAAAPATAAAAAPPSAPWTPVEHTDAATGARSVSASEQTPQGRLVLRCDRVREPVVSVQFIPAQPFRGYGALPVSIQADSATPLVSNWELMGHGAINREVNAVTTLSVAIAHARTIRLHTVDAAGTVTDVEFHGPGEAPIRRVVAGCGFTFGQTPAPPAPAPQPSPTETP